MQKEQVNRYNMLLTVEFHFDDNAPIWTSNIPISDVKTALSNIIDQITAAATQQGKNSTGTTKNKALLRTDLEEKGLFLSEALSAYAAANHGQDIMYDEVHIPKSTFPRFREDELLVKIENLNASALLVLENLEPYGVTQQTLTDMMAAREAFFQITRRPVEIASSHKTATDIIPTLLNQAEALLDNQMDNLVGVLKATQPEFVSTYFNDRKIHHIGVRTLSLEILTLDASTNSPLAEAHIEIVGKGIKRISSDKGQNRVQNLLEGYYTLSVSHPDFVSQTIPFTIITHETTQLVIEMQKQGTKVQRDKVAESLRDLN